MYRFSQAVTYPYEKVDPTRKNYTAAGAAAGGGLVVGLIAGALTEISQETYMTAPELNSHRVNLYLQADLFDVRGWKNGYPKIHPKKLRTGWLDLETNYRKDRISSTTNPTANDQKLVCEVIRLTLAEKAKKTLTQLKLCPQKKK